MGVILKYNSRKWTFWPYLKSLENVKLSPILNVFFQIYSFVYLGGPFKTIILYIFTSRNKAWVPIASCIIWTILFFQNKAPNSYFYSNLSRVFNKKDYWFSCYYILLFLKTIFMYTVYLFRFQTNSCLSFIFSLHFCFSNVQSGIAQLRNKFLIVTVLTIFIIFNKLFKKPW